VIFFKKKPNNALTVMEDKVITAFSQVNGDIEKLKSWLMHIHAKSENLHNKHDDHVSLTRRDIDKVNNWLMHIYAHNRSLQGYIKETTDKVRELYQRNSEILEKLNELERKHTESSGSVRTKSEPKSEPVSVTKNSRFEENIMSRIRPNRKSYIIQEMLKLIEENKYSTKEIEYVIVREKNLCGRTAFYSYLKELRLKDVIGKTELGMKKVLARSSSINEEK